MLETAGKLARDDLIAKDIGVNEWRGGYAPPLTSLQSGLCNSMQRYPAQHKSPYPLDPRGERLDGALACHGTLVGSSRVQSVILLLIAY